VKCVSLDRAPGDTSARIVPQGLASWLVERTGAQMWMSQAEYFAAHAMRDGSSGFAFDRVVAMSSATGCPGRG